MGEFEFSRFVGIGQYLPNGSPVHRLDPRARLLAGCVLLAALTAAPRLWGLAAGCVGLLLILLLARISPLYALRTLLPPLPFIAFLAVFQLLFGVHGHSGAALWEWGPLLVSSGDLLGALLLLVRFAALMLALSLLSFCISTTELIRGLEALLRPLTAWGFPTHDLVLLVQVALHFVPLLLREAERIAKAQASRGAVWGTRQGGLLRRARQALPVLVPLFLTALRRAENLALAMEARAYSGDKTRASMVRLRFAWADGLALSLVCALAWVMVRL